MKELEQDVEDDELDDDDLIQDEDLALEDESKDEPPTLKQSVTSTTVAGKPSENRKSKKSFKNEEKKERKLPTKCFCDPTPKAYRVAAEKARLRYRDASDPMYYERQEEHARHLKALENVKSLVDCKSPLVPKAIMHGLQKHNKSTMIQAKIEAGNAKLLTKLASIYNGSIPTGLHNKLTSGHKTTRNRTYERTIKAMELVYENIKKYQWLQLARPYYSNKKTREWYAEQIKHRDRICKYPHMSNPKVCPLMYRSIMAKAVQNPRQYAYLLVEIEDLRAENIVIELFADECPFTVKNFQRLCTNTKATACDCRTYRCKKVDRLHSVQVLDGTFRKIYWVIGEHVDSTVEFTPMMLQESSPYSHTEAGLVCRPKGRSGGVFFITVGACTHLDNFCYVFGKVVSGIDFLQRMQTKNVEENGSTVINMHVTDCGVVDSVDQVPPPMLLQDFISQVRLEIMPFLKRNPKHTQEWVGGKTAFADHLREKITEAIPHFEDAKNDGDEMAEEFPPAGAEQTGEDPFRTKKKKGHKSKHMKDESN